MLIEMNGGLKENWYALLLSIKKNYSSKSSLKYMGINSEESEEEIKVAEPKKSRSIKIPSKLELEKLYVKDKMQGTEIAKIYNVSPGTVYNWLKTYNLKARKPGGNVNVKDRSKSIKNADRKIQY